MVDDAIVVLENVERIMTTENLPAPQATEKAMEEVTRPVIAIVLVLTAVFMPVAFMGGLVGEMYRQFAVTISVSVVISGFVALTLTPALCALLLKHDHVVTNRFLDGFNRWFERVTHRYETGVRFVMRRGAIGGRRLRRDAGRGGRSVPGAADVAGAVGRPGLRVRDRLPAGRGFAGSHGEVGRGRSGRACATIPPLRMRVAVAGMDPLTQAMKTNSGIIWLPMKPWDERKNDGSVASGVWSAPCSARARSVKDGFFFAVRAAAHRRLVDDRWFRGFARQSRGGGSTQGSRRRDPRRWWPRLTQRRSLPARRRRSVRSVPQMRIDLDREKAMTLGRGSGVGVRNVTEHVRCAVRERLQSQRPCVSGAVAVGAALPCVSGRYSQRVRALEEAATWCR